ncbi:hypothetical protein AeMF1_014509 [Aphanomyces euteiches]|nr:hypothetical protein AeMF1_014509 [Aphanomyces euteiches]
MVVKVIEVVPLLQVAKTHRQRQVIMLLLSSLYVEYPLIPQVEFDLMKRSDTNARREFRFDRHGIQKLGFLLSLPAVIVTERRNRVLRDEAMCILLGRLAFPCQLYDMTKTFGRSEASLCDIFLHVVKLLYSQWKDLLFFNRKLVQNNVDRYCQAITAKGAPTTNVFGFIDGTKVQICRIKSTGNGDNLQKQVYSGHKRLHCLSYQAVTVHDGICVHFFGPVEGRKHDTSMLRHSGLLDYFLQYERDFESKYIYGDPAYGVSRFLLSGFKGNGLTERQKEFNKWMSRVRQSVEWNFKIMKTLWSFITFKNLAKVRLSPVAKIVCVAMLLTNCHCCYHGGNQISKYFGLEPPNLEDYLDVVEIFNV